ncbi:MAG: GLPGLI family protein [Flavobacteriaceae bacterium]|nr:GLPGLI family protein [Flavobacteriaceae bacterium]
MNRFLSVLSLLMFWGYPTHSQNYPKKVEDKLIGKVSYVIYSNPRKCTLTDTTAVLYLNPTHSLFVYAKGDDHRMVTCDKGEDVMLLEANGNMVLKNFASDTLKIRELVLTTVYRSYEALPKFNWTLGNKEKTIANYKVKNATTRFRGRSYEAWFSEEIPISDGPWKFNGLPGLILEVYDTDKDYFFTIKNIEIPANPFSEEVKFREDGQFLPIQKFLIADHIEYEKIKKESQAASNIEIEVKVPPRNPIELTEN